MWKLPVPDTATAGDELSAALTYVNGRFVYPMTPAESQAILHIYEKYDRLHGVPAAELVGEELAAGFMAAMHDAYREVQIGRRLADLRSRLLLATQICPYCGFGEIRDLDHHLPRSKYKALAIYGKNLVPCCPICNNIKRAAAGENPDSQFFHTYMDEIPDEEFLFADASISNAGLKVDFSIRRSANMSQDAYVRLAYQFEKFELNRRYQSEVSIFITTQRSAIETLVNAGGRDLLRAFLQKGSDDARRDFGMNDWRTAFWRALAGCPDFFNGGFIHAFGIRHPGI